MNRKLIWLGLFAAVVFMVIAAAPPIPPPRVQLMATNLTGKIASPTNFLNPNVNFYAGTNVYLDKTNRGLRINIAGAVGGAAALTNTGNGIGIVGDTGAVTPIKSFKVSNSFGSGNFLSWETNDTNITLVLSLTDGALRLLQNIEPNMFNEIPPDGSIIVYDDLIGALVLTNIFHLGTNFGLAAAGSVGGGSGESNTMSSSGAGVGINNPKSAVNLPIKSFTDSSVLLTWSSNATEIDLSFDWATATGELATVSYVRDRSTNSFRVAAGANITAVTNYTADGVTVTFSGPVGGSGEVNTMSSSGSGVGINNPKSASDLPIKSFTDSSVLLAWTSNSAEINLSFDWSAATGGLATVSFLATNINDLSSNLQAQINLIGGETNTMTSTGTGVGINNAKSGVNLPIKSFKAIGSLLSYATNSTEISITFDWALATNGLVTTNLIAAITNALNTAIVEATKMRLKTNGIMVGSETNVNFLAGANITILATNVNGTNTISISAASGGSGTVYVQTNAIAAGSATNINFIAGANITLSVTNVSGTNHIGIGVTGVATSADLVSGTNIIAGYVREQASNDVRVTAGGGISVTPTSSGGVMSFAVATTGGAGADPLTINSNIFYTMYDLTASSQSTNFIWDFNIALKTNNASGAIHLQQSTNRSASLGKPVTIVIRTGTANRGFSYNANWTYTGGSVPPTLLGSNLVWFVNAIPISDTESGVYFSMFTSGTNGMSDSDVLAKIAEATNNLAHLAANNTFTGGENKFKMVTAEINAATASTNLFVKNSAMGDSIGSIFFQNNKTDGNGGILGLISTNFSASSYRGAFVMQSYYGPIGFGAHVLGGGGGVGGNPMWAHSNKVCLAGLTIGGDNSTGGNATALLTNMLYATATLDFASTLAQTDLDMPITLVGAKTGDIVSIGAPIPLTGAFFSGFASNDVVFVRLSVYGLTAKDPASGAFKVKVEQFK